MRKTPPSTAAGDVTDERKSIELLFRFFFTKEHAPSRFRQRTGHPLSVRGLGAPNVRPGPGETRKERARARRKRLFFLPPLASFCSPSRRSPRSKTRPPPPFPKSKNRFFVSSSSHRQAEYFAPLARVSACRPWQLFVSKSFEGKREKPCRRPRPFRHLPTRAKEQWRRQFRRRRRRRRQTEQR